MAWIVLVVAAGLLLMVGVEHLMRRLGIRPAQPGDRAGGMRDVLARIKQWQRDHARRRR